MCFLGENKNKSKRNTENAESVETLSVTPMEEEAGSFNKDAAKSAIDGGVRTGETGEEDNVAEDRTFDPVKGSFYNSSRIFGKSEDELEVEFKNYKTRQLFKKISLMLTDPYMPLSEFNDKLEAAISLGLAGVSVLYDRLEHTLKRVKGQIEVNVCVCFPYAADDIKSKIAAVKKCLKTGVNAIEIPINLTDVNERNIRTVERDYRKLRTIAKNKDFILIADISQMTPTDVNMLARILRSCGIVSVKTSCALNASRIDDYALNNLKAVLNGQAEIIACSSTSNSDSVVNVFAIGAEKFAGTEAIAIAESLKKAVIQ